MSKQRPLQGGCSCGRNQYIIRIPQDTTEVPRVFFDNSHAHRRSQATPLSAWLRIPLSWYQSTTESYLPDETHSSIRRSYTSPHEQNAKRHFCGFCGTPLSYWSEQPASEASYICLTLGSLSSDDLRGLEDLGLLPAEAVEDAENDKEKIDNVVASTGSSISKSDANEGLPWFETLVEGSRLGKIRKSWGSNQNKNVRIEWEIMEWTDTDGEENIVPGKRKIGEVVEDETMTR